MERGETAEEAVIRELQEEAGVSVIGRPQLVGVHANHRVFRGDHVLVYRVDQWAPCAASQQGEIKAVGWFAPDALPADASPGTRRRIAEALAGERSARRTGRPDVGADFDIHASADVSLPASEPRSLDMRALTRPLWITGGAQVGRGQGARHARIHEVLHRRRNGSTR